MKRVIHNLTDKTVCLPEGIILEPGAVREVPEKYLEDHEELEAWVANKKFALLSAEEAAALKKSEAKEKPKKTEEKAEGKAEEKAADKPEKIEEKPEKKEAPVQPTKVPGKKEEKKSGKK